MPYHFCFRDQPTIDIDHKPLNDKVEVLEKIVHTLTRKVLSLEAEAEKGRKKDTIKVIEEPNKPKAFKVKDGSDDKGPSVPKNPNNQNKNKNKKDMEMDKESEIKDDGLYCTKCNYKCKKETILKKHMMVSMKNICVNSVQKSFLHNLSCYCMSQNTPVRPKLKFLIWL